MSAINLKKIILYFALAGLLLTLWDAWQQEHHVASKARAISSETTTPVLMQEQETGKVDKPIPEERIIRVKTDVLDVKIDSLNGDIIEANLLAYKKASKSSNDFVRILSKNPEDFYISQSGLLNKSGSPLSIQYSSAKTNYLLEKDQKELVLSLKGCSENNICVIKNYEFFPGQYTISLTQVIRNDSSTPWAGQSYEQLQYRKPSKNSSFGLFGLNTYSGAAYYTPAKPYTKLSFETMQEKNLDETIEGGWLAMQQRYFLSAWIPDNQTQNRYFTRVSPDGIYTLGFFGPMLELEPSAEKTLSAKFYVGPEDTANLKALAKGLDLTIDYGWLWIISNAIFWVMKQIHRVVGNWGWSIVLITLLIKLIFFKLSETSYRSMAKMRQFQPRIMELKERYGNDKQQLSKATIELYRKEKINPLGGCLPFLVQIPVFIALYYVLIESVELRHAPFMLWIQDLSSKDPYFILPVLMGISMLIQQRLNPPPTDPVQAKVMMLLPIIFTIFFIGFPSGLVLYWLVNSCLSILQQWYITSRIEKNARK